MYFYFTFSVFKVHGYRLIPNSIVCPVSSICVIVTVLFTNFVFIAIEECSTSFGDDGRLQLSQFDIQKVLVNGASLLGSEGAEYEEDEIGIQIIKLLENIR